MQTGTFDYLIETRNRRGAGFLLLIDPDAVSEKNYLSVAESAEDNGVDAILVGSSFTLESNFSNAVALIKNVTSLPMVIFPGSFAQVTHGADAILFTSLVSGRNPSYLIDEQVKGAPLVKKFELEPIPTAYMLIESGPLTSVQFISGTIPIPRHKNEIACAHALAAQYMGMKLAYLEAGSGAQNPVPCEMIQQVSNYIDIPLIVGGGLKKPDQCAKRVAAGASFIVVGNATENDLGSYRLAEIADAIHTEEKVSA